MANPWKRTRGAGAQNAPTSGASKPCPTGPGDSVALRGIAGAVRATPAKSRTAPVSLSHTRATSMKYSANKFAITACTPWTDAARLEKVSPARTCMRECLHTSAWLTIKLSSRSLFLTRGCDDCHAHSIDTSAPPRAMRKSPRPTLTQGGGSWTDATGTYRLLWVNTH